MNSVIEPASTGRSKCRGCGNAIAKGQLRFGDSVPNPYAEGETLVWFHLRCAACMRPEQLLPVLEAYSPVPDDVDSLKQLAEFGVKFPRVARLARAERAASGRAHCRVCREAMEKGRFRLALQVFEDGRMNAMGSIHLECAEAYFGTADILDRIARLTPDLDEAALAEIQAALKEQRPAPPASDAEPDSEAPGLAKTAADASESDAQKKQA